MEDIKIEKGIPMPVGTRDGKWIKIARQMEIGDSIIICSSTDLPVSRQNFLQCVRKIKGRKFSTRKINNEVRAWRIE